MKNINHFINNYLTGFDCLVLWLCGQGYQQREIADMTDISYNYLKVRLFKIRKRYRHYKTRKL